MRAIQVAAFGGPEVLVPVTVAGPVPGRGEALIAVSVADVLFLDTMIRSGRFGKSFPIAPPYVPGNGVAGEVIATGGGVDRSWIGRGWSRTPGRTAGRTGTPNGWPSPPSGSCRSRRAWTRGRRRR